MKNLISKKSIGFSFIIGAALMVLPFDSFAQRDFTVDPGGYQRVETNCMCGSRKVGSANDCGAGGGMCIDQSCSQFHC